MTYLIDVYKAKNGKYPFNIWLEELDSEVRQKIRLRIQRLILGNFGNCEPVGNGISELKIDFGPGYRIYFIKIQNTIILILNAGTKKEQQKDIDKAKEYLLDFKSKEKIGKTNDKKK